MHPDIHLVTRLQTLDTRISELDKEIAALPKHIAQIEKALDAHNRRLEADRAALTANQKDRKKLEADIQIQEQKASKLRDQMLQAKTNEQYRAFQNEISFCETEVRKAEDRILDLMGASEPLEANVKKAEAALKEEKQQVESEKLKARERTSADQSQKVEAQAERKTVAAQLRPQVLSMYQRASRKWHGHAVSEVVEGRCSGCQISLRPQFFEDVRQTDAVLPCESCGRIIFYNPPIDVEKTQDAVPAPTNLLP